MESNTEESPLVTSKTFAVFVCHLVDKILNDPSQDKKENVLLKMLLLCPTHHDPTFKNRDHLRSGPFYNCIISGYFNCYDFVRTK